MTTPDHTHEGKNINELGASGSNDMTANDQLIVWDTETGQTRKVSFQTAAEASASFIVPGDISAAPAVHTHAQSDITDLVSDLAGKQASLTGTSEVPGLDTALAGKSPVGHNHDLSTINDSTNILDSKQDNLTGISDVPGLQTALDNAGTPITGTADVPGLDTALAGKAASAHTHPISEITALQTALDAKQDDLTASSDVPGLTAELSAKQDNLTAISDVPGLVVELGTKQDNLTGISDVPGLQSALDAKDEVLLGTSDVPGLDTALAGKAASSHTHTASEITDAGTGITLDVAAAGDAAAGELVKGDDSRLSDNRDPNAHSHVIADVTGLQAELDLKLESISGTSAVPGLDTALAGKSDTGHGHVIADVTGLQTALDNATNEISGTSDVPGLDTALAGKAASSHTHAQSDITSLTTDLAAKADLVGGKVPSSQIPSFAVSEFLGTVASEVAMLALSGDAGDWAIRSDEAKTYVLTTTGGSTLTDWQAIAAPSSGGAVDSINGQTGVVVLGASDVGAAATSHTHIIGDVTGLQSAIDAKQATLTDPSDVPGLDTELAGKAASVHTHVLNDITDAGTAAASNAADFAAASHTHVKADITDFDEADYAAASHTHTMSEITDSTSILAAKQDNLTGISDVPGLQAALDLKDEILTGTSDVPGLDTALAGKAASSHTHTKSEITDFDEADYAAASHTHAQSEITDLVSDLAGKAASSHTHTLSDITDAGTAAAAATGDFAAASHTHTASEITDFNSAVDARIPAVGAIDTLTDVDTSTAAPTDEQVLTWDNSASKWKPADASGGGGGASAMNDLTDATIASVADGDFLVYNSTTSKWENETPQPVISMSGGNLSFDDDEYTYHIFTSSGNLIVDQNQSVDFLVLGGGGAGGGSYRAGGGGAGGLRSSVDNTGGGATKESSLLLTAGTHAITIGAGGTGVGDADGNAGGDSSIGSLIVAAGGGGGAEYETLGNAGGSGGGTAGHNSSSSGAGGAGTANQGFAGGARGPSSEQCGSGGGGAGGVGQVGGNTGTDGFGGVGAINAILSSTLATTHSVGEVDGSDVYYGGGGSGSAYLSGNSAVTSGGGKGGGADGVHAQYADGNNGTANTGGGGSGSSGPSGTGVGGDGGSGLVIIRYVKPTNQTVLMKSQNLSDMNDVNTTTSAPAAGQVLVWNNDNSEWVPDYYAPEEIVDVASTATFGHGSVLTGDASTTNFTITDTAGTDYEFVGESAPAPEYVWVQPISGSGSFSSSTGLCHAFGSALCAALPCGATTIEYVCGVSNTNGLIMSGSYASGTVQINVSSQTSNTDLGTQHLVDAVNAGTSEHGIVASYDDSTDTLTYNAGSNSSVDGLRPSEVSNGPQWGTNATFDSTSTPVVNGEATGDGRFKFAAASGDTTTEQAAALLEAINTASSTITATQASATTTLLTQDVLGTAGNTSITYAGSWQTGGSPAAFTGGVDAVSFPIDVHSDVTTTSPSVGDVLEWDGSAWVNSTPSASSFDPYSIEHVQSNTSITLSSIGPAFMDSFVSNFTTTTQGTITDDINDSALKWTCPEDMVVLIRFTGDMTGTTELDIEVNGVAINPEPIFDDIFAFYEKEMAFEAGDTYEFRLDEISAAQVRGGSFAFRRIR